MDLTKIPRNVIVEVICSPFFNPFFIKQINPPKMYILMGDYYLIEPK